MVLPFIIGGLLSTHVATQWLAGRELEKFGPAGKAAIPALAENLSSWPWWISRTAIAVPGNHGPDAAAAVPALEKILQTTSQSALGAQAAVALGQINSPNTNALALVSAALDAGPAKTGVQTFISREHALQAHGLRAVHMVHEPKTGRTAGFMLLPRAPRCRALKRPKGRGPKRRFMGSFHEQGRASPSRRAARRAWNTAESARWGQARPTEGLSGVFF